MKKKSRKKRVLSDHKQDGKKFVPKLMQDSFLAEVNWTNQILPELFWIGLLFENLGYYRANTILPVFHGLYLELESVKHLPSFMTSYESLKDEDKEELRAKFSETEYYKEFIDGLSDLQYFYPENPLSFMFVGHSVKNGKLDSIKRTVEKMSVRRSKEGMVPQVTVLVNSMVNGKLHAPPGSVLREIGLIEDYPNTEKSKEFASSVRAMINTFMHPGMRNDKSNWAVYFWQHSYEHEPSQIKL